MMRIRPMVAMTNLTSILTGGQKRPSNNYYRTFFCLPRSGRFIIIRIGLVETRSGLNLKGRTYALSFEKLTNLIILKSIQDMNQSK